MNKETSALAVRYSERGNPLEVTNLESVSLRKPSKDEVLVRMLYAPINPADINTLEGTYGELRSLPDTPGNEGIGIVEAVGPEVEGITVGRHVQVSHRAWCEGGIWKASELIPLHKVINLIQGAMLRVNPASAFCMLKYFHTFAANEWVAQNSANSGVGRWVIALSKRWKIPAVHLARRPETVEKLIAEGAENVFLDDAEAVNSVKQLSGKGIFPLALNAVGGESAGRLSKMLGTSGTLVTYGAMSKKSLLVSNGALIFKDLRYRGFWVHKIVDKMSPADRAAMYHELLDLSNNGIVKIPVAEVFPLSEVREALRASMLSARPGKVLLRLSEN
ncbi:MAG: 2-enoyl thioester reductase domain-containing protein [Chthoniobacterales bacterium]